MENIYKEHGVSTKELTDALTEASKYAKDFGISINDFEKLKEISKQFKEYSK